jgi:hypothetical protein
METHTGILTFGDGEVALEDGTVLAVAGSSTPLATAAGRFAKWGETQAVTVTGTTGIVNNAPVLFVTSIQWAAAAAAAAPASALGIASDSTSGAIPGIAEPTAKPAAAKPARSRSKK